MIVKASSKRRSVYVEARRSRPVALLQAFDAPVMVTNCEKRSSSTVATQSLMLMNGSFILEQASTLAERCRREAERRRHGTVQVEGDLPIDESLARQIAAAWELAYGRPAAREELELGAEFIRRQLETLESTPRGLPEKRTPAAQAMTNLCQMLLISNEFLYVQ